jgi:hypothetical protein
LEGKLEEKNHLEELGVDGRIILNLIFINWAEGMDCSDMDRDGKR